MAANTNKARVGEHDGDTTSVEQRQQKQQHRSLFDTRDSQGESERLLHVPLGDFPPSVLAKAAANNKDLPSSSFSSNREKPVLLQLPPKNLSV